MEQFRFMVRSCSGDAEGFINMPMSHVGTTVRYNFASQIQAYINRIAIIGEAIIASQN
jgi:hypothetical protein